MSLLSVPVALIPAGVWLVPFALGATDEILTIAFGAAITLIGDPENRVEFETDIRDTYGMPKPTFHFALSADDRRRAHTMMGDMLQAAGALGGFLPGSEPRFLVPGSSLHFQGHFRMGEQPQDSVTDPFGRGLREPAARRQRDHPDPHSLKPLAHQRGARAPCGAPRARGACTATATPEQVSGKMVLG